MSFRTKTILGIALIETVLLALLIFNSLDFLKMTTEQELIKRANTASTLFAAATKDAVLSSDLASLETFVEELLTNPDIAYVRIRGTRGVLAQGGTPPSATEKISWDTAYEHVTDGIFDTHTIIQEGGKSYGQVEIGLAVASLQQQLENARIKTFGLGAFELLLSAFFSLILGTYLTRRLQTLERSAHLIAQGQLGVTVSETGNDELARLACAFNEMSRNLALTQAHLLATQEDLEKTNQGLELLVEERTQSLRENNLALEQALQQLAIEQQKQLQQAFNQGVAEQAISVLHNIANAITPCMVQVKLRLEDQNSARVTQQLAKILQILATLTQAEKLSLPQDSKISQLMQVLMQVPERLQELMQEEKEALRTMDHQLRHVAEIITLQQKYAHLGRSEEAFSLSTLLEDALRLEHPALETRKIQIEAHLASNLPPIKASRNKFLQVLVNLIKNALESIDQQRSQYPEHQGCLWIESKMAPSGGVEVSLKDNGAGAAAEVCQRVFEFGFTTKSRGSGFGLHDCANFFRSLGGSLQFHSSGPGQGASLTFVLPGPVTS